MAKAVLRHDFNDVEGGPAHVEAIHLQIGDLSNLEPMERCKDKDKNQ